MKIPTHEPSGGRIWVFAFWGLRFVKIPTRMPSGGRIWVFTFWGLRFVKIPTRMPSGVAFKYLHSGGCDS